MDHTSSQAEHDILIATLQDLRYCVQEGERRTGEFALEARGDSAQVISEPRAGWKAKEPGTRARRNQRFLLQRRFRAAELKAQPREESGASWTTDTA
jgi:hypothetical protein